MHKDIEKPTKIPHRGGSNGRLWWFELAQKPSSCSRTGSVWM